MLIGLKDYTNIPKYKTSAPKLISLEWLSYSEVAKKYFWDD